MSYSFYPPMAYFHNLPALWTSEIAFSEAREMIQWVQSCDAEPGDLS